MLIFIASSFGRQVAYVLDKETLIVKDPSVVTDEDGAFFITGRNDAETFSRWIMSSEPLRMPCGMYELEANYDSVLYELENSGGNCDDSTGVIQLISQNNSSGFQYNEIDLFDGRACTADRVWVRSFTGIDDLEVKVCFYGVGDLHLKNIVIRELPIWRLTRILAWLLAFLAIDAVYVYFFTDNQYQNKPAVAALLATTVFSSLPLFANFLFWGHDMNFHMARIWSLAEGMKHGHLIVPIQTEMINGYGYATPLFYSQLFLYIPAVLYLMAAPLQVCYQIYAILINAATCLICYYCVKGLLKSRNLAAFGAALYTLSAYRIANLYVRAAVGEYTAMAFFPLALYGFAKVYMAEGKKINRGEYLPIVFGLSGMIQCHVLSCELSAFFILALCILCIKKTLQPARLFALIKAALLTVGVNFAFLLPFLQSMQMDVAVRHDEINEIQDHGTYLLQVLGIFMPSTGDSKKGMAFEMPMAIGFALIIGLVAFLACCVKKQEWGLEKNKLMRAGVVCSGFAIACIVFSTRFFPWDSVKNISGGLAKVFCMIQFPWRYLSLGTVFCVFAALIGIKLIYECKGAAWGTACCGVMMAFMLMNTGLFYMTYGNEVQTTTVYGILEKDDYISSGEYLPANTIGGYMNWRRIVTDETTVTVSDYEYTDGVTSFWCGNASDDEKTVEIPLLNYDNYHAYALNGGEELAIRNGENNYVNVVVKPHYEGMVQVRYEIPVLWKLSYAVSAVVLIGICIVGFYDIKKKRASGQ